MVLKEGLHLEKSFSMNEWMGGWTEVEEIRKALKSGKSKRSSDNGGGQVIELGETFLSVCTGWIGGKNGDA